MDVKHSKKQKTKKQHVNPVNGDMSIPLQSTFYYDDQVSVWSNCLLDLDTNFLVGNMVFVRDVQYLAVAPHFHGLYSSLELCCEGP